jgi:hypothetical protein
MVGVDIIRAAAEATERDRSGIYANYHVVDMARLSEAEHRELADYRFNCLTCVAALGFGDIPPEAFAVAYNLLEPESRIAFNIKADFLEDNDPSGFARLIRSMMGEKVLEVGKMQRYQHRLGTDGQPIYYVAIVGTKRADVDGRLLSGQPQ